MSATDIVATVPFDVTAAKMTLHIEAIDYHRNGIGGEGFFVVAFRWAEKRDEPRPMLAIVFPSDPARTAVLDREQSRRGNIFMHRDDATGHPGGNAWRGDHFQPALWKAIRRTLDYNPFEEN